ncbi:MAG: DUF4386 domain-containing protein [Actinomycetota bacterium]|nr:DUF4386 domain-containing protein [Actinomycetota bacterium]
MAARPPLVGTRLAAVATVLYFLEWVAIAFLPSVPTDRLGDDPAAVVDVYRNHAGAVAYAAGWFSFVLLGRILFAAALRQAFRDSGRQSALLDFAVAAMAVSVALEVASFVSAAAAGWLADAAGNPDVVAGLDAASAVGFVMIFAPVGASVVAFSAVMLSSGLLPRWIGWLGLAAGALGVLGGVIEAAATGADGTFHDLGTIPSGIGAGGLWVWLVATSVVLWRAAPPRQLDSVA